MATDLSKITYDLYERALTKAKHRMDQGDQSGASAAYREGAGHLRQYATYLSNPQLRKERLDRADSLLKLADKIDTGEFTPPKTGPVKSSDGETSLEDYEEAARALVVRSSITWSDIGGLEETKAEIKSAYGMSLAQKPAGVKIKGWSRILFYGPSGTGKTLLAAATSNGIEATFFSAKVSDLLSKYFGESTKLISALYATARKFSPAVIFLDEIDSLMGERGGGESGAERRIVSTFLSELDGLRAGPIDQYVLTIAATNLPWLLDTAILRRFEKRIYIPLPDQEAREAILRIQIEKAGHQSLVPWALLAERCKGYSGSELERFCSQAVQNMVQEQNPSLNVMVDKGKAAVTGYLVRVRPLSDIDFDVAFANIRPETREDALNRYAEWKKGHAS